MHTLDRPIEATVSNWGKSTAVRLPAELVKSANIRTGQKVRLESTGDGIITIRAVAAKPDLDTLLALVTAENMPDEADIAWGKPVGNEVW